MSGLGKIKFIRSQKDIVIEYDSLRDRVIRSDREENGEKISLEEGGDITNVYIEVTHSELIELINSSSLEAGSHYLITDFQTIYIQPDYDGNGVAKEINEDMVKTSEVIEPLVIVATANNKLSNEVKSLLHPEDFIEYDYRVQTFIIPIEPQVINGVITEILYFNTKGKITRRRDEFGNDMPFDFRYVKFKRYAINPNENEFQHNFASYKEVIGIGGTNLENLGEEQLVIGGKIGDAILANGEYLYLEGDTWKYSVNGNIVQYPNSFGFDTSTYGWSLFVDNKFYLSYYTNVVYVLNSQFQLITTLSINGAYALSYNESLNRIYVGTYYSNVNYYIDTITDTVTQVNNPSTGPSDVVSYNPFTNKVYSTNDSFYPNNKINVFDENFNFLESFNIELDGNTAPTGTEWNRDGWSNLSNITSRTYVPLLTAFPSQIFYHIINEELVMFDVFNNEYYKFIFHSWTAGNAGGGFSYTRTKLDTNGNEIGQPVLFTKSNYGSEVDSIAPSIQITRANNMSIYNPQAELSSFSSWIYPWYINTNTNNGDIYIGDYDGFIRIYDVNGVFKRSLFLNGLDQYLNYIWDDIEGIEFHAPSNRLFVTGRNLLYVINGDTRLTEEVIDLNKMFTTLEFRYTIQGQEYVKYLLPYGQYANGTNYYMFVIDDIWYEVYNETYYNSGAIPGIWYLYSYENTNNGDVGDIGNTVDPSHCPTGEYQLISNTIFDSFIVNGSCTSEDSVSYIRKIRFFENELLISGELLNGGGFILKATVEDGGLFYQEFSVLSNDEFAPCLNNRVDTIGDNGTDTNPSDKTQVPFSYDIWRINTIFGPNSINNRIGYNCFNNTIGVAPPEGFVYPFNLLTKDNTIGNNFQNNMIGVGSSNNIISNDFKNNFVKVKTDTIGSPVKFFRNNIILSEVNDEELSIIHFYENYTCEVIKSSSGELKLRYVDGNGSTIITKINE
jgi:hypothetical protein